jgi:uncharacterized alpha-E superfamily protein
MKQQTLSRVAERLYWLGRYIERIESTARLINVNANLLIDLPVRLPLGWQPLIDIMGTGEIFAEHHDEASERNVVRFLTSDTNNPGSIVTSIHQARENIRTVRDIMPHITFEYVNDLYLYARGELAGQLSRTRRVEVLGGITRRVQQLEGFLAANMMHDDKWNFLRLGNYLERADMTTRIIDVRSSDLLLDTSDLVPFEHIQWRSVLRSLFAEQSYYASMNEPIEREPVLEFLFTNTELPRSYARCVDDIRRTLRRIPRADRPLRAANRIIRNLKQVDVRALEGETLHDFIDECQLELATLHDEIGKTYFYFKPRRRRA